MVEEIVKTALLGTDRYQPQLSAGFTDVMEKIAAVEPDKEARFLKQAAAYFMMQSASFLLMELPKADIGTIESEVYIHETAQAVLQSALAENNEVLLQYCFWLFTEKSLKITPFLVPDILEKFESAPRFRDIAPLCGQTGREILKMRNVLPATDSGETEDMALAGFTGRKKWVDNIRATDPVRIWDKEEGKKQGIFEAILDDEKPDKRCELLELLYTGLSAQDEEGLSALMKSKSKNVKLTVIRLLASIPKSQVQKDFTQLLHELLSYQTQKQFFGLKKTEVLVLNEVHELSPAQKSYGLEEISNRKDITDAMHHLYQCILCVPLQLIADAFAIGVDEVTAQLYTGWKNDYITEALIENAKVFRDIRLIRLLLKDDREPHLAMYLPFAETQEYFRNILKNPAFEKTQFAPLAIVFEWLFSLPYSEIDNGLATGLLGFLRLHPYHIQGRQYYQLGLYFPQDTKAWIENALRNQTSDNSNSYFLENIQSTYKAIEDKNLLNQQTHG